MSSIVAPERSGFARVALRHGLVTEEDLVRCEEAVREGRDDELEELLVEAGHLTDKQVRAIRQRLIREVGGYRILGRLGSGGMGAVYRARHERIGRECALKILPPKRAGDRQTLRRFEAEAQLLARLDHPNIVKAIDYGKDKGFYYLSMELVEGNDLRQLVAAGGPMSERLVIDIALQVARGLAHAGDRGLIHRDIKPANILLTPGGVAKILDFGLAKPEPRIDLRSFETTAGFTFGTPEFMSPEQIRAKPLDARTDLYSLGVTLYFLLTARLPYEGREEYDIVVGHLEDAIPDVRFHGPGTSRRLSAVLQTLLAKRPEDRYASAAELIADLERIRDGKGLARTTRARRRRLALRLEGRTAALAAGALAALLLLTAAVAVTLAGGPARTAGAAPPDVAGTASANEAPAAPGADAARPAADEQLLTRLETLAGGSPDDLRRGIALADDARPRTAGADRRRLDALRGLLVARRERLAMEGLERLLAASPPATIEALDAFIARFPGTEAAAWAIDRRLDLAAAGPPAQLMPGGAR